MKEKYISDGTIFDKNTTVYLELDLRPDIQAGIFRGTKNGNEHKEICFFSDFIIICED